MSIPNEITRLSDARDTIRTKFISLGIATVNDKLDDLASAASGITIQAAQTYTPGITDQTIASGQYLSGAQTIKGDSNLVAANIADGVTIFGVEGTHQGGGSAAWAAISVTYPVGSTCTATNGSITLTAEGTGGNYLFEVPQPSSTPETWTVSCTDGSETRSKSVSITSKWQTEFVFLTYYSMTLNDNSWADISEIALAGTGDTYWDLGDAKEITFKSGATIGTLSVSGLTLCVFILSFNHVDGNVADNNILFGGFKSGLTNGKDVALVDSNYNNQVTGATKAFNWEHWSTSSQTSYTYGGWRGCDLRYDILGATTTAPSGYGSKTTSGRTGYNATQGTIDNPLANTLMAAIPDDFRVVLRLRTHYTDNFGNKSTSAGNVTAVVDAVSLLSETEIQGGTSNSNPHESEKQTEMGYYAAGNSRIRYKHNAILYASTWLTTSQAVISYTKAVYTDQNGASGTISNSYSLGIAPVFKV